MPSPASLSTSYASMTYPRLFAALALLVAVLGTGACQTLPRDSFTAEHLAQASPPYRYDFNDRASLARFEADRTRILSGSDSDFDLLALSGGGANGAFGAGVVIGWRDRPEFDIVTGVSTGALIAPFVFGGHRFDAALERAYTSGQADGLLKPRGLLALFLPGVFDPQPLRDLVLNNVTDELIRAVAAEHAKGRRLYVATTSLDTQTQIVWDMGALASRADAQSRLLFVNVLIASASIPGAFPPVPLTFGPEGDTVSELHVDGGATANFLVAPQQVMIAQTARPAPEQNGRLWVLINGSPNAVFKVATISGARIAERSFDTVLKAITRADLANVAQFARANSLELQVAMLKDPDDDDALDFSRENMARLFAMGRAAQGQDEAFETIVSAEGGLRGQPAGAPGVNTGQAW